MNFNQKTAIVTGSAAGIGAATAKLLCERNIAAIILLDVAADALQQFASELKQLHSHTQIYTGVANIADNNALREALQPLLTRLERVDILVNSAGVADENEPDEMHIWHKVLGVNLHGTYHTTIASLAHMPDGGRIINVSSILGRAGNVRNTAYCTSKHALLGFTKSLALDVAPRKITVNAVLPAWVDTPMLRNEIALNAEKIGVDPEQMLRNAKKKIPLKRLTKSEDVANLIAFLASNEASSITAQSFTIDGGFTCGV
ncbi:MAG: SDR family NAD(P)-dependent oxidoreductase [Cellvibrio sp.]|uniref:SDR family NAD(P)-dependent oxidoreductase n=1 Tax=Cellvibrio sp. TaxID=1965322 RepID=UPI0027257449|nr:SDR family NAD(P)-dependent oxidoreductase [Cellvibrio sp.]